MHPRIEFNRMKAIMDEVKINKRKGFTLLKTISKAYYQSILSLGLLSLTITVLTMTAPILTHKIISYVKVDPQNRNI